MSETGLSLEQPGEIVGVTETPPEPQTPPEPPPNPEDADPEGTITGEGGIKFVPLGAVIAERGKRKEAEGKLKDLPTLQQKAAAYDSASAYLEQARPVIEAVKRRPDLIRLAQEPAPPPAEPAGPLTLQEAEEFAKDLQLYLPDGKLDVATAQRIAARQDRIAERRATATVAPLQQTEATRQSSAYFAHYASQKDPSGNALVDVNVLREVWAGVPPEMSAKPEVAQVLYLTAMGKQVVEGKAPRITAPPPVVPTESVGGVKPPSGDLSETELKFMRAGGMKREEFIKVRDQYKPGSAFKFEE